MRSPSQAVLALGGVLLLASPARAEEGRAFSLAGRATAADGTPRSGRVLVTPTMPAGPAREAVMDADARFFVEGLARATVTVEVVGTQGLTLRADGIGLPHAQALALREPADLRELAAV